MTLCITLTAGSLPFNLEVELRICSNYCIKYIQVEKSFYEIKGDVGMSLHEKGRNKKMPTPIATQSHS